MSFIFDKEAPSCFSSRVSKVRRANITENVKLQRQIAALEIERSYRHYQIHHEKKDLEKQLQKLKEIRGLPVVLERRNLLSISKGNDVKFNSDSTSTKYNSNRNSKPRSFSAPSSLSLPAITCRCALTGYKVRTRKLSRENSSASLPVTREELEVNSPCIKDIGCGHEEISSEERGLLDVRDVCSSTEKPKLNLCRRRSLDLPRSSLATNTFV